LTRQVLEGAGFRVLLAADGPSGITLANTALPHLDLLICDLTMPGMSGSEVASIIHKMSPSTKILLSSGYVANSMSMPAIDENYATFFPKPYRIEELLAAVVNQIGP
jgi:two-component system, cell cycle sensor histidine kinase and response regulator CckA